MLCDFQPIARLSDSPNILAVHPSLPGSEDFVVFVRSEVQKWAKVVTAAGMTAE